jgi:hypothetical protein
MRTLDGAAIFGDNIDKGQEQLYERFRVYVQGDWDCDDQSRFPC